MIAELLDDIVPLEDTPRLRSWSNDCHDVFEKLISGFRDHVHLGRAVDRVRFVQDANGIIKAMVRDDDDVEVEFDKVIFACSAPAMLDALHGEDVDIVETEDGATKGMKPWQPWWPGERFKSWLESFCLRGVTYTYERDPTFKMGEAHSQPQAVCPLEWKDEIMSDYCNYVEVDSTKDGPAPHLPYVENSFIISSWAPPAQKASVKGKLPMLVSYNCRDKLKGHTIERPVTSFEGHPCLTKFHLAASNIAWPLLQGSRGGTVYFCGSTVTPGNGHDLSLLSGMVAASECGAAFPYAGEEYPANDFSKLRGMMMWY